MLPAYLQCAYNALPDNQQVIVCEDVRFTVLTSRMIRIETGAFTDQATLTVICRSFDKPSFYSKEENGVLTLRTEHLVLSYKVGSPLTADSLSVRLLDCPYTLWHYGDRALNNLGGTVETLDQINGACPLGDGVCAVDGFAVLDDSQTPLMLDNGWFAPRDSRAVDCYFFGYGHDYTAAVQDYYRLTGVPEMLPAFALGNWWSRYYKYTEESYLQLMDEFRAHDIPLSVGIVDMDWHLTDGDGRDYRSDGWTGYTFNHTYFPNPKRFLQGVHDRNLKTALNLHPASGVRHWEEQYEEMAARMGVDATSKAPVPFNCLSEEFWAAYFEVLHFPHEENGVDFWWMDWQQGTDYRWIHPYDATVRELECMHPLWMVNHMHYLASKRNGKRGLIFSRFSGYGSQRYPIGFSGDTVISWDSLAFQPYFTATASNVGYSFWSHDIGGHMGGYRDDELNARWIQFGVFSPIFRMHSTDSVFTGREPWNYNKRTELVVADFMRLRHQLFPYIYTMCYRNCTDLIPLLRPLYHTHPEEAAAYRGGNVYWFGSELIAAPITRKADRVSDRACAEVWLPKGKWIDWFTGYVYDGGETIQVYRPLEQMPLFCKAGAIVPMQAHMAGDNHLGNSKRLQLVIAAGASNCFTLYEDDGESLDYERGICATTQFKWEYINESALLTICPAEGELSLLPDQREYTVVFKGFTNGCRFFMDEEPLAAIYDPKTASYMVTLSNVSTVFGTAIRVSSDSALQHNNCDYYERIVDLLTRAQCELSVKEHWLSLVDKIRKNNVINEVDFVNARENHLARAVFELLHQVFHQSELVPPPGLPE